MTKATVTARMSYSRNGKLVKEWDMPQTGTVAPPSREGKEAQGRTAWKLLHAAAAEGTITGVWLEKTFFHHIPIFSCGCRREWLEILKAIPLRPADQVQWAIDVHNAVNVKLGKPVWTPPAV
jgi:hypothetical protein